LVELGIVKEVSLKDNKVTIVIAFPALNIPIGDYLVNSIKEPIEKIDLTIEVKITAMNQNELNKFLDLEQKNWKGGI
jgi:metal-sulfur cluster biosynthetic enzyme